MSNVPKPLELFVSYAHKDEPLKDELLKHLSPLRRLGLVTHWNDRQIDAGAEWSEEIEKRLKTADIILLLISPDFIHSDFCYTQELAVALERHRRGECSVIPVFLRSCDWKGLPFGKLQGVPDDAMPVVSNRWPSQDDAFANVARRIRSLVEKWRPPTPTKAPAEPKAVPKLPRETTPVARSTANESGVVRDSGAAVLLGNDCFESDSVIELDDARIEVRISPASGEEETAIRLLKPSPTLFGRGVEFAHRNHAFDARVQSLRSESTAGRQVWIIELQRISDTQPSEDPYFHQFTAVQICTARAEFVLLGKMPSGKLKDAEWLVTQGCSRQREEPRSIFPEIWERCSGDVVKFLRWARLAGIYALISSRTCAHIIEFAVNLQPGSVLEFSFTGERKGTRSDRGERISLSGTCGLEGGAGRARNRRKS